MSMRSPGSEGHDRLLPGWLVPMIRPPRRLAVRDFGFGLTFSVLTALTRR